MALGMTLQVFSSRHDSSCNSKQLATAMRQAAAKYQATGMQGCSTQVTAPLQPLQPCF